MPTYHVSIAFAQLRDTDLLDFAGAVLAGLTDNPIFPTPPVSLADLAETKTDFARALTAAATGGPQTTAAKNIVRATLGNMLRKEAYYVQSMMNNDLSVLLATGFQATSTNRARSPLPTPSVVRIDNEQSTQLVIALTPIMNARAYEVQKMNGTGGWTMAGVFTKARRIVIKNLVPGSTYSVQARAVGGSTGYSGWSNPVSHMAT
jgi:hypothetical protein